MKKFLSVAIVAWFFFGNQYFNGIPTPFNSPAFLSLQACEIQRDRFVAGLMTNNDPALTITVGPCYSSDGRVKADANNP